MSVSVIVPTYNGATKLPNLLAALEKQLFTDFEVIIVSDGSTDNTADVVKQYKSSLQIQFIHQENKGRSATRNKGTAIAKNELLVFFDDDMRPLPNCLEEHVKHHQQFPNCIVTGGLKEEITSTSTELFRYKSYLSSKWLVPLNDFATTPLSRDQIFVTTANFSIEKSLFNSIGGFEERLTDAEDYEFAVRAYKMNISLYFNNKAFAWHDDTITTVSYIIRQRQYAIAQAKLFTIHSDWLNEGFIKSPYKPTGTKATFFKSFCSKAWINSIDNNSLKWLPQSIKYRLYDYIITANGVFFPQIVDL
ncbi:MAG: glycosyltransferase [Bacteroidota bacterium]